MYESLGKLYYKLNEEDYQSEIKKRHQDHGGYKTNLTINGFLKGKKTKQSYSLFFVHTHQLMTLNNLVLKNSSDISLLITKLPEFIVNPYFHKLIINEAQSNNEIEGIKSTKRELSEALHEIEKSEPRKKRFLGLVKTYLHIDEIPLFDQVEDFRKLYDELVAEEVADADQPDGKLFRKGYIEVNDGTKTTHIGVSTEEQIIHDLNQLVLFLQDYSYPELYKYMVAHYYYEYIHPFYDGNGRTGRLLVGSYLSRYLEKYSALTFSYSINKNKNKYYKALEAIAHPLNHGELTFYLIAMLELLAEGQKEIIEDLELNLLKFEKINQFIEKDERINNESQKRLVRTLSIFKVFIDENDESTLADLMSISKVSRHKTKKNIDELIQLNYVEQTGKNPLKYQLTTEYFKQLLIF